jgi:hypothetical protein
VCRSSSVNKTGGILWNLLKWGEIGAKRIKKSAGTVLEFKFLKIIKNTIKK